jgi:hypothetical protein
MEAYINLHIMGTGIQIMLKYNKGFSGTYVAVSVGSLTPKLKMRSSLKMQPVQFQGTRYSYLEFEIPILKR